MSKIILKLYHVIFHNDQRRLHLLPECTMEWGQKVFNELLWWGDVDIFCEHPVYNERGEMEEWSVSRVEPAVYQTPFKQFDVMIMETHGDWEVHQFQVEAFNERHATELSEAYVFLVSRHLTEVISVEKIK